MVDAAQIQRRPNRFLAAWHVLMGRSLTPLQIQAEWLEYKLAFDDIMQRFGSQLARQAKQHKRILDQEPEPDEPAVRAPTLHARKAELRTRAAAARGIPGARVG